MKIFAVTVIIAAALLYGALSHHFILMDTSIKILKKTELTLEYIFVDARGAKKYTAFLNPALAKAGIKNLFTGEGVTVPK